MRLHLRIKYQTRNVLYLANGRQHASIWFTRGIKSPADFLLWSKREDSTISGVWNTYSRSSRGHSQPRGTDSHLVSADINLYGSVWSRRVSGLSSKKNFFARACCDRTETQLSRVACDCHIALHITSYN